MSLRFTPDQMASSSKPAFLLRCPLDKPLQPRAHVERAKLDGRKGKFPPPLFFLNLIRKVKKGTLLIDSSTIDPAVSKEMAVAAEKMGAVFMDAPVTGGRDCGYPRLNNKHKLTFRVICAIHYFGLYCSTCPDLAGLPDFL